MIDEPEKGATEVRGRVEYEALINALAKKAARDHMRNNSNADNILHVSRAKRVGLRPLPPAA